MFEALPANIEEVKAWGWPQFSPFYEELLLRPLDEASVDTWLADWNQLNQLVTGRMTQLKVATDVNTADAEARQARDHFTTTVLPPFRTAEVELTKKLLATRLVPEGMALPLKKMTVAAQIFRPANLPYIFSKSRFIMLITGWHNWERCKFGLIRLKMRQLRWQTTAKLYSWVGRKVCLSFLEQPGRSLPLMPRHLAKR